VPKADDSEAEEQTRWEDALDVWRVRGVGCALGIILCGVFARITVSSGGSVEVYRNIRYAKTTRATVAAPVLSGGFFRTAVTTIS
jgi:ammonia channel protein AmtB